MGTHCQTAQAQATGRRETTARQGSEMRTNACRAATAAGPSHTSQACMLTTARAACSYDAASQDRQGGICRPARKKTHREAHKKACVDTKGTHIAGGRSPLGRQREGKESITHGKQHLHHPAEHPFEILYTAAHAQPKLPQQSQEHHPHHNPTTSSVMPVSKLRLTGRWTHPHNAAGETMAAGISQPAEPQSHRGQNHPAT